MRPTISILAVIAGLASAVSVHPREVNGRPNDPPTIVPFLPINDPGSRYRREVDPSLINKSAKEKSKRKKTTYAEGPTTPKSPSPTAPYRGIDDPENPADKPVKPPPAGTSRRTVHGRGIKTPPPSDVPPPFREVNDPNNPVDKPIPVKPPGQAKVNRLV